MTLEGVLARYQDRLLAALKPGLALRPTDVGAGRSRLGGSQMLARPGEAWPSYAGSPMALLAQVDLKECAGLLDGAPQEGVLQAFISTAELPKMGDETTSYGPTRLRFLGGDEALEWIEGGTTEPGFGLGFEARLTPPDQHPGWLLEEESDLLHKALPKTGHQILGHPFAIQYDPLDYPDQFNPKGNRVLVLQIDSDETLGWNWVDSGVLYFLADREAFSQGRIEDVLFEMQFF